MKKLIFAFLVFALLGFAASASAQAVINPTGVEFTASADHAALSSYEIGWFLGAAVDPVSMVDIGKPTPDASNLCKATISVMPLPFNQYTAKVRAKAGTVYGEWSDPSNVFFRAPGKPGGPVIKK
jgi:hypothetical protein